MRARDLMIGLLIVVLSFYAAALLNLPLLFLTILYTACLAFLIVAFVLAVRLCKWAFSRTRALRIFILVLVIGLLASGIAALHKKGETDDPESRRAELQAFPYLNWASKEKNIHYSGVVLENTDPAGGEFNLYGSKLRGEAYLMDMKGNYRHTWKIKEIDSRLHHVKLDREGNLFAIGMGSLFKLNWNGDLLWKYEDQLHHDVAIAPTGEIYTISNRDRIVLVSGIPVPILDDLIVVLSPAGKMQKEISLYDSLRDHNLSMDVIGIYRYALTPKNVLNNFRRITSNWDRELFFSDPPFDRFHANSIEVVSHGIPGFCKKEDLLLSVREQDLVILFDSQKGKVSWSWTPGWRSWQHDATLLLNGNILLFDNSPFRGYSRVLEMDHRTGKIVWQYVGDPRQSFLSPRGGASQRLPNGHTLITVTDSGRVFELNSRGNIVWEFYNPEFDKKKNKRAIIYRMTRITEPKMNSSIRKLLESSAP